MRKYCQIKLREYDQDDNFVPLGETQYLDLAPFIGKKDHPVSIYFRPEDSDASLVKLDATVTIRPSASKVTSKPNFKVTDPGPFQETMIPAFIDRNSDPELKQVWNHPVFVCDYA